MIKNIEIIEYKCFRNFKLDNLSQINIITGGNNVGKTALLEALFIENEMNDKNGYYNIFPMGTILEITKNRDINTIRLPIYLKNFIFKSKNIKIEYKLKYTLSKKEKDISKDFNKDYYDFLVYNSYNNYSLDPIDNIINNKHYINPSLNYIDSSKPTNQRLIELYSNIQTKGIQHKFLEYLKVLDNNISWIEPQLIATELLLRVNLSNPEYSVISSELGEGTNRFIEILSSLLSNSNGVVFIDEIENGIHYSKLKDIWKAIIEIVKKENIQLFVTTHDKDTIEALNQASEELEYEDITSIELFKKDGVIHPIIRVYDSFNATVDSGMDVR